MKKFLKFTIAIIHYIGTLGCGMGIALLIEYGICLDTVLLTVEGLLLGLCTAYSLKEHFEEEENECEQQV